MRTNMRLRHIEKEVKLRSGIHKGKLFVTFFPSETEEEREFKLERHFQKLKQEYGNNVSLDDIGIMRVVYDEPAKANKEVD